MDTPIPDWDTSLTHGHTDTGFGTAQEGLTYCQVRSQNSQHTWSGAGVLQANDVQPVLVLVQLFVLLLALHPSPHLVIMVIMVILVIMVIIFTILLLTSSSSSSLLDLLLPSSPGAPNGFLGEIVITSISATDTWVPPSLTFTRDRDQTKYSNPSICWYLFATILEVGTNFLLLLLAPVSLKPFAKGLWSIFSWVIFSFWYAVTAMNVHSWKHTSVMFPILMIKAPWRRRSWRWSMAAAWCRSPWPGGTAAGTCASSSGSSVNHVKLSINTSIPHICHNRHNR